MTNSPRNYDLGDTIPNHGVVVGWSSTAYLVEVPPPDMQSRRWVPFYGPRGVDTPTPVEGLVTFADDTRYGWSVGSCPCECNRGWFCGGCGHAGCGGRR